MSSPYGRSADVIARHPIQAMLAAFPFVCFTLTLLTDIAFWRTSYLMWQHFSEWLLFAGLIFGALAALAGLVGLLLRSTARERGSVWPYAIGGVIVLALAFVNSLVHAADGWTGVVPNGLILSAVTVIVMFVTAWLSRSITFRHRAGE